MAALALLVMAVELKIENRALLQKQSELQSEAQVLRQETERERSVLDILTASDTVKVTLVSGTRPAPEGKAFYHAHKGLLFYTSNLPAAPSGRTYQLWIVPRAGQPHQRGRFPSGFPWQRPGDAAYASPGCNRQSICGYA